jgi:hypothetical protein
MNSFDYITFQATDLYTNYTQEQIDMMASYFNVPANNYALAYIIHYNPIMTEYPSLIYNKPDSIPTNKYDRRFMSHNNKSITDEGDRETWIRLLINANNPNSLIFQLNPDENLTEISKSVRNNTLRIQGTPHFENPYFENGFKIYNFVIKVLIPNNQLPIHLKIWVPIMIPIQSAC